MSGRGPLIAHVIFRLDVGGMENGLVNLINNMPHDDFDHAIVCLDTYTDFSRRIKRDDVQIHALHKRPGKDPMCYWRLWKLLKKLQPDIVHTRNIGTLDAGYVARLAGVDHIIHGEHGWDVTDLTGSRRRYRWLRRKMTGVLDRYVAVSRHIENWLVSSVGVPGEMVVQIYNGVDAEKFTPINRKMAREALAAAWGIDGLLIGTVGRLEPVKNPLALMEAFSSIVKRLPKEARLVFIGSGSLAQHLESRIYETGLRDRVSLLGARSDVADLLPGLDLFVLPSLNEGVSNTILEAMACGVPVLASDVGGNGELVADGETGRLYNSKDRKELTELIVEMSADHQLRGRYAAAARQRVESVFSLHAMVSQYTSLYAGLTTRSDVRTEQCAE